MKTAIIGMFGVGLLAGCHHNANVQCQTGGDCNGEPGGMCVLATTGNQWCAYPDQSCDSGYRYSNNDVGDGLAGACVAPGGPDASMGPDAPIVLDGRPDGGNGTCTSGVITFVSKRGGNADIYSVYGTGTNLSQITTTSTNHAYPRWAPGGAKIAFTSDATGDNELYVMNANGSGLVNVSNSSANDAPNGYFDWSPDGQTLVFTTNRDGNNEIYSVSSTGTGLKRLTTNSDADADPHWSPDGNTIAFTSFRNSAFNIWVMDAAGTNQRALTTGGHEDSAKWSPDGSKVVFISWRTGYYDVWSISSSGTNETNLTNTMLAAGEAAPFWSPDSKKIGFYRTNGTLDLWVMDANGQNAKQLTNDSSSEQYATFSPDNNSIVYASNRSGNLELYSVAVTGSTPMNLTNNASDDYEPVWVACP